MKNLLMIGVLLICILALTGCNEYQRNRLVSDQKGMYNLDVVGDDKVDEKLDKDGIDSIFRISISSDYEDAENATPYLEIDKNKPNYFLFDTKDLVYQTTSYDELVKYLKENPDPK